MDKSKLQSLSEKIKSGGAQMTRMVSLKVQEMKEMLASPTPESRIVDQATSPGLEAPDWGLNLRICSLINGHELSDAEVVKSIKRKINSGDVVSIRLSLELLEACAMNCDKVFSEIASQKLLDDLLSRLIENPEADRESQGRAMELIRAWGESEDLNYLPAFRQTYENLKTRIISSQAEDGFGPYDDEHPVSPPESYPIPGGEADGSANEAIAQASSYDVLSPEKKKQILEITRNNIEVFSSLLGSTEPNVNLTEDDLTITMLEKCKDGQSLLQRIVQSTNEDEGLLFEALNLNDELHQVILKFEDMKVSIKQLGAEQSNDPKESSSTDAHSSLSPEKLSKSSSEDAHNPPAPETLDANQVIESSKEMNTETVSASPLNETAKAVSDK